jgi:archaeal type IV pilus assembly protein PilA
MTSTDYSTTGVHWDWVKYPTTYPEPGYTSSCTALWQLCFRNPDNVGKDFTLTISDKKGNLISKTDVKIVS